MSDPQLARVIAAAELPGWCRSLIAALAESAGQRMLAQAMRSWGKRSVDDYWQLVDARNRYRADLVAALDEQRIDALLCPPYPLPAVPHGATARLGPVHGHTLLFNLVGMPAGVVASTRVRPGEESDRPPHRDRAEQAARAAEQGSAGLPIGVQVAARHWREDVVLAVLAAIEAARA